MKPIRIVIGGLPLLISTTLLTSAAEFRVAPNGHDGGPGSRTRPFRTVAAAQQAARSLAGKEAVTIHLADGVYYLPETLVFTPADSGTAEKSVVYRAEHEGRAILSGGLALQVKWEPWRDGIYRATTPAGLAIDQLFVNGQRQRMARYPNYDAGRPTAAYQGYAADAFSRERAARWADPAGGYIHAMHVARWGGYHYRITGKQADGSVQFEGGWQNNRQMGMHKEFRMVENIFEELDAAGEWFHDAKSRTLYFQPQPGIDLGQASVEVVRLRHLIEFRGTVEAPVRFVSLQGIVFRHAARTFMDTREPLLRSDWTIYRGGAVLLTGTERLQILDCTFDQVGGNAIFVNGYNRQTLIRGCHIAEPGASGICFVGKPEAVRDPLFEYSKTQDPAKIDRTPGPKSPDYPAEARVEDCLLHGLGQVERQVAGVQISMAQDITVRDTSIYDCARAGINISEGTWGGHLIERVDVFNTVLETHDHGSFNSWGRDRYWSSKHRQVSQPAVKLEPDLPFLDAMKPTVIRDSRWRCDHGWDIDLDDGSSNYEIYNNLLLAGGLKFREGYRRKAWNNVIVNNGFHPHVWFEGSGDEFRANIVMRPHAEIGMPANWGKGIDRNFFTSESARTQDLKAGCDTNSISGDPQFLDAKAGDFRVRDGSPALRIGFTNFPMNQFGVKKASLKALAKTPVIPDVQGITPAVGGTGRHNASWLGAELHELQGEEYSAFGVAREEGGVQVVEAAPHTAAFSAGLRQNDLIQAVNGRQVKTTEELLSAIKAAGNGALAVRIVRNQQAQTIQVGEGQMTKDR